LKATPPKLSLRTVKYPDLTRPRPFILQFTSSQHIFVINGIHPVDPLARSWPLVHLVLGIRPVSDFIADFPSWSLLSTGPIGELHTMFVSSLTLCLLEETWVDFR
jgi:hypothetical protein